MGTPMNTVAWLSSAKALFASNFGSNSIGLPFMSAQWTATNKPWTQPLGFRHALIEVAVDVFRRTRNIDSPEAVREAIRATNYQSIVGPIAWSGIPVKNVTKTPLVGGQWMAGKKFKHDLVIVNNDTAKTIPVQQKIIALPQV